MKSMLFIFRFFLLSSLKYAAKFRWAGSIAREDCLKVGVPEMLLGQLAEDISEICGQCQITTIV